MTLPCSGRNHIYPQLNWRGPVSRIRGALQQSSVCVSCLCVCLSASVSARSNFCIVSVVWCVRGTQAHSGESIWDIYYALHQSFWTLDISLAEQIVSYQNSISEMTCRNSLPSPPTHPPLLLTLPPLLPPSLSLSVSIYLFAFTPSEENFHTDIIMHMYAHTLERTNEVQSSTPPLSLYSIPPFPIA